MHYDPIPWRIERLIQPPTKSDYMLYIIKVLESLRKQGMRGVDQISGNTFPSGHRKYTSDTWQLCGRMGNEQVFAILICTYDVDNLTKRRLHFRQLIDVGEH